MAVDYAKALKCAQLSQEVYREFNDQLFAEWVDRPVFLESKDKKIDTQGAILRKGNSMTIVFRGSSSNLDWKTNFELEQERSDFAQKIVQQEIVSPKEQIYPYEGISRSGATMHRGFSDAYQSVREEIHTYIKGHDISAVMVTGHSLGGALATLCVLDVQYNFSSQVSVEMYTFGAPKVGNKGFQESFDRRVPNSYRVVNGMDIVPALPRWWQGYRHVNTEVRVGQRFSLQFLSQRFKDHAIDRYIDLLEAKRA
jgi:triacylglycerol lipase